MSDERKEARDILMRNIPGDCYWEEMDNLTNTPVDDVLNAMIQFAQLRAANEWRYISETDDKSYPSESNFYLVCNENSAIWVCEFDEGFVRYFDDPRGKIISWQALPSAPPK